MDLRDQLQATLSGNYTLERELGGGGMSRVFVAEETALGRKVVIKVLPPETAAQVSLERFKREILLAAKLQHPHIVPLLSAGESEGLPYFTMPLVEGESLRVRLARHGELPVNDAIRILREIASALAYAHEHGIVHRDIKPDNVLLSGGCAMVTDFGVAKALSASSNAEHGGVTSLGVALGTPAYMAPEQATADPAIDHRADIYAFGVLAYELLTGQPPFAGRTPQNLLAAHVTEAPEGISRRRTSLPPALAALVMRCLEKRPADRPQTAVELVQALDAIVTPSGGMAPTGARMAAARPRRSPLLLGVTAGAVVFVLALVVVILARHRPGATATGRSVAVLPFESIGADKGSDYLSEGITEEITEALSKVPGLRVPARSSATASAAKGLDLRRIGTELGVGSVLQGTIQRSGNQLRITAQLINVADNSHLWSDKYDKEMKDVFLVQDEIAKAIVTGLRVQLGTGSSATLVRASTADPEAHNLYLQALYLWNRRTGTTLRQAIAYLQRAIERDPRFARAHAGLALAYAVLPDYAYVDTKATSDTAIAAARRALALDSTLAEAYAAIAVSEERVWHNTEALASYQEAILLDSSFATAHHWYALELSRLGRFEDAIREIQRARELEPASLIIKSNVGIVLYFAGRLTEAEAVLRQTMELDSTFAAARFKLGVVLLQRGLSAEAITELERAIALDGKNSLYSAFLAHAYAVSGRTADARRLLNERMTGSTRATVSEGGVALVYSALGEHDKALEWLQRGVDRFDSVLHFWGRDKRFDRLRADPRGKALFARTEAVQ
jgi:serine/threonine-protein kinase